MYGKKRPDYIKEAVAKAHSKKIYQYDKDYNLLNIYDSGYALMREKGYDSSYISKKCKKKEMAYGYIWSYEEILPPTTTERFDTKVM